MSKKTIQEYQKAFEEIAQTYTLHSKWLPENLAKYEQLAKACIADFPNEDIGYVELGKAISAFISETNDNRANQIHDVKLNLIKIKEIAELTRLNFKYIKTELVLLDSGGVGAYGGGVFADEAIPDLIYREPQKEFIEVYKRCAEKWMESGYYTKAEKEINVLVRHGLASPTLGSWSNPSIDKVYITNFLSIDNIVISDFADKKEIYFLGENGVGKTVLLQAILLGLIQNEYRNDIYTTFPFNTDNKGQTLTQIQITVESEYPDVQKYLNLFAYGTGRFRESSTNVDEFGYSTLFDRDALLINPIQWFEKVRLRELEHESPLKIETVLDFFTQIINFDTATDFKIERHGSEFIFYEQNTKTDFKHLAEGYRSILIWLSDLLSRLTQNQPYIDKLEDFHGIVLVDEIDMFLHPKWEYSIVRRLREKLPNIQWFFTTHSPILVLGASEDAVFYKLYKENGITKISEPWKCSEMDNLLANAILTSPLFDMETARMRAHDEKESIDTSANYWYSKIKERIDAERNAQKTNGKAYFSDTEIQEIVNNAVSTFKTELK